MTKSVKTNSNSSSASPSTLVPASQNPAVACCQQAWQRTFDLAKISPDDDRFFDECNDNYFARAQAARAFLGALPPLAGHENIRDFIACVAYGVVTGTIMQSDAKDLLYAAQVALTCLRLQPKSQNPAPEA